MYASSLRNFPDQATDLYRRTGLSEASSGLTSYSLLTGFPVAMLRMMKGALNLLP
jgi:hypothetical protein